jgi:hypothetical protein
MVWDGIDLLGVSEGIDFYLSSSVSFIVFLLEIDYKEVFLNEWRRFEEFDGKLNEN